MVTDETRAFAAEWIAAWNSRDLDRILSHYADDVVFLSPYAEKVVGNGRINGLAALRDYWQRALERLPKLHFEFDEVRGGYQSLTILYRNHRGERSAESFEFGPDGKVVRSIACYGAG